MKNRQNGFLDEESIDHNGEIFNYIRELHTYLWRFVRVAFPGTSGLLDNCVDAAIDKLEEVHDEDK